MVMQIIGDVLNLNSDYDPGSGETPYNPFTKGDENFYGRPVFGLEAKGDGVGKTADWTCYCLASGEGFGNPLAFTILQSIKPKVEEQMIYILVCEFRFIIIGNELPSHDPKKIKLGKASCIRKWGTTEGLGELAMKGKLPGTILDPLPEGTILDEDFVKMRVPCDQTKWAELL